MAAIEQILQSDDALRRVVTFARRFGESYISLAMHAAMPFGLTPDLLHLVRINFVNTTQWIAEADLLLSPLCREVGGELYEMIPEVRELLLDKLRSDSASGPARLKEVAEFLFEYSVRTLKGAGPALTPDMRDFLKTQELVALAYARPDEAARLIAVALDENIRANDQTETIRIANLAEALTAPLLSEEQVLLYSVGLKKLSTGENSAARSLFEALGPLDQVTKISGVELPAPSSFMPTPEEEIEQTSSPATVIDNAIPVTKDDLKEQSKRSSSGLSDKDWLLLLKRIRSERCMPIIGPGVNHGWPLGGEIARELAARYKFPLAGPAELSRVAQYVSVIYEPAFAKEEIARLLMSYGRPEFDNPGNIHGVLANLPLPLYLSLTYDDFMAQALSRVHRDTQREMGRWNKSMRRQESPLRTGFKPTVANPLVFQFFGNFEVAESMVVTDDDYLDLFFNTARDPTLIPPGLERALVSNSLILLGVSFEDFGLRIVLQLLNHYLQRSLMRTSFIQLPPPAYPNEEQRMDVQTYQENFFEPMGIKVYWGSVTDFSNDLKNRWQEFESEASNIA